MTFQPGRSKTGGRRRGVTNKRTQRFRADVSDAGITPLGYMTAVLNDPDEPPERKQWAAAAAAPFIHPRLAVVDSTVRRVDDTPQLTDEQRRERARAVIREAFRERPRVTVEGEYKVIAGYAISEKRAMGSVMGGDNDVAAKPLATHEEEPGSGG